MLARRRVQLDRHADQPERHRSLPHRTHAPSVARSWCRRHPFARFSPWWGPVHDAVRVKPMLASPAGPGGLPLGAGWSYEVKWDGYRAMARSERGRLRLDSRSGLELVDRFPALRELAAVTADGTVLDGEVVALVDGVPELRGRRRLRPALPRAAVVRRLRRPRGGRRARHLAAADRAARAARRPRPARLRDPLAGVRRRRGPARGDPRAGPGGRGRQAGRLARTGPGSAARTGSSSPTGAPAPRWSAAGARTPRRPRARPRCCSARTTPTGGCGSSAGRAAGCRRRWPPGSPRAVGAHPADRPPFDDPVPATARKDARWCDPVVVVQVAYRERTTGGVLRHPVVLGLRDDTGPDPWEQP